MKKTLRMLSLSLATAGAALCLAACSAAAPAVTGVWGDESQADSPNLTLHEDGSVSGSDGCNRIVGAYTVEGDTVSFGNLAATMRFCEGVETWLGDSSTATVRGNDLLLQNAAGEEIGTLARAK